MSEQPAQTRICPTCGNTVPAMARYCPSCGTRLDPKTSYTTDDFEDVLADVLEAQVDDIPAASATVQVSPDDPTSSLPPATATTPGQTTEWNASASDWAEPADRAGTWTAQTSMPAALAKPRGNRTLWIILAILGFIIFCCCGLIFTALLVDGTTSASQKELSRLTTLLIG